MTEEDVSSHKAWGRRSFLKVSAVAGIVPRLMHFRTAPGGPQSPKRLPPVPAVEDLRADRLVHKFRDLYSSPTAQNEFGYVQATKSVSGITALSLPPFACCGVPDTPWSPGFLLSCELFVNGRILLSYPDGGDEIAFRWYPHRIVRETQADGLKFSTETFMPAKRRAAAEVIRITNVGSAARMVSLGFDMRAAVAKKTTSWLTYSPGEADNRIHWDASRGCLIFEAQHSQAFSVQGILPKASRLDSGRMLVLEMSLGPRETKEVTYVNAVDAEQQAALGTYDHLQANFAQLLQENAQAFNSLLRSAVTPGNAEFSGYLPQLETDDESLWKLYQAGFRNLIFARRASPDSKYGTTYLTLGGRVLPTLSFPWDRTCTSISPRTMSPERESDRGMPSMTWPSYAAHRTICE